MKNLFLPYEESLALKELGFDDPCLAYFTDRYAGGTRIPIAVHQHEGMGLSGDYNTLFKDNYFHATAPIYSQAFKWFRDTYKIEGFAVCVQINSSRRKAYQYVTISDNYNAFRQCGDYDSYEEAQLDCIRELIKIVKSGKHT